MITRFAVLPDSRRLLLGLDKAEIFEAGYVYEVSEIMGEYVIRKLGKYSLAPDATQGDYPTEHSDANDQIYYGRHLFTMEEHKMRLNAKDLANQ